MQTSNETWLSLNEQAYENVTTLDPMSIFADTPLTGGPTQKRMIEFIWRFAMPQSTNSSSQLPDGFAPLRSMLLAVPRVQASAAEIILKQQKELFQFLAHRCDRDLEFIERLSQVDDFAQLPDIFSTFMRGTSKDYADEARKSMDAGSRAASELSSQLKDIGEKSQKMAA